MASILYMSCGSSNQQKYIICKVDLYTSTAGDIPGYDSELNRLSRVQHSLMSEIAVEIH